MPRPKGAKIGPDYQAIKRKLDASGTQHSNTALFDTFTDIIDAAARTQGFIDNEFPQLDGSQSSLYNAATDFVDEFNDRSNTKYCIKLTLSEAASIAPQEETVIQFDTVVFDDGLMHWKPDDAPEEIRVNHHGMWHIGGRVVFCSSTESEALIKVNINGIEAFRSQLPMKGKATVPFLSLEELDRNDIVTLSIFHSGKTNIDVLPTFHMHRVSWVRHDRGEIRYSSSFNSDSGVCSDTNTSGTDDCICEFTDVQFAVLPQSKRTYFLNKDAKIIGQTQTPAIAADKASTFCPNRKGNFYIAIDDSVTGFTRIEERTTNGQLITDFDLPIRIGQGPTSAAHCLMEEPCGMILSINRATHQVVEYDLFANQISRILGLTINPFDGAINQIGNRLVYIDGTTLKCWDLVGDSAMTDIAALGYAASWPTWLADCSILIFTGTYLTNGNIIRYSMTGTLLKTYTYDQSKFPGGLIGYAANKAVDRLWIVGLSTGNIPATIILKLSDGSTVGYESFKFAPTVVNETAMVGSIYYPVKCIIAAPV